MHDDFNLAKWCADQLNAAENMQVSYAKKVMALKEAPAIVQARWLKERLRELEVKLTPVKEKKAPAETTA